MKLVFFSGFLLVSGWIGPAWAQGTVPAPQVDSYDAYVQATGYSIGARILAKDEIQRRFVSPVYRGHTVVEVAIYPHYQESVDVRRSDFTAAYTASGPAFRAEKPAIVAARLQKTAPVYRDYTVTPQVGIGYETGTGSIYDPNTGTYRQVGGWTTRTGVGIDVSEKRPGASDEDRKVMETELSDKELLEGPAQHPVSGYLYFPMDLKSGKGTLSLTHRLPNQVQTKIEIPLP
jgi:hypothetical protein